MIQPDTDFAFKTKTFERTKLKTSRRFLLISMKKKTQKEATTTTKLMSCSKRKAEKAKTSQFCEVLSANKAYLLPYTNNQFLHI